MSKKPAEELPATPKPGIYPNVSMAEYHSWDLVSSTRLKPMIVSPLLCKQRMDRPPRTTQAMVQGQALHAMLLEPDTWREQFAIGGPINEKTKKPYGRETNKWAEWEAEQGGKPVLTTADIDDVIRWADAICKHEFASQLLAGKGRNEMSLVWDDQITGLRCKARVDRLTRDPGGWPSHIDIKTTKDEPTDRNLARLMWDWGYDLQMAHYKAGAAVLKPGERKFWFVFICKGSLDVGVVEMGPTWEAVGAKRWRMALDRYAECLESGKWPGCIPTYMVLEAPVWALHETGVE